jgi:TPR repeat protein
MRPLLNHEIELRLNSYRYVIDCLNKTEHIYSLNSDRYGRVDLKKFSDCILNKASRDAMHINWVLCYSLILRVLIEFKKIRNNLCENPFLSQKEIDNIECDLIAIEYDNCDNIGFSGPEFEMQAWAWNSFRGTILDLCEPKIWPVELIKKNLSQEAYNTLFANVRNWKEYSYNSYIKYNRTICKWMYGWKAILPGNKAFSENNGMIWLNKLAVLGNADARRILAETFSTSTEYGNKQRAYWYLRAAELGDAISEERYAECCMTGRGVTRDYIEGLKWLRRAADKDMSTAQTKLAYELLNGKVVDQDFNEAVILLKNVLKKPSGNYDEFALRLMGACYKNAYGVEKNVKLAAEYFSKAAELGDLYSMYMLSKCLSGGDGIERNLAEAYYWILKIGNAYHRLPDSIEFIEYSKKIENEISIEDKEKAEKRAKK